MITFKKALRTVLRNARPVGYETVKTQDSLGRINAQEIRSKSYLPEFDNSAMDGFAVNYVYTKGANIGIPVLMRLRGEVSAGERPRKTSVSHMASAKIFTGAPLPRGANAVIRVEDAEIVKTGGAEFIKITKPVKKWENVRFRGENIRPGQSILEKRKQIRPQEIGIMLQAGVNKVRAGTRPKVAILATGNELAQPGQKTGPGKIVNVNSYTLAGEVLLCGGIPVDLGIARDDIADLRGKIRRGLKGADILVVSAGISVGEHDYVKKVLSEYNVKEYFWKVLQRPGEPLYFGKLGSTLVFGLPGNTVSSIVCFKEYVKPAILKMQGAKEFIPAEINAALLRPIKVKPGRRYFLRGFAHIEDGKYFVKTTGEQGSGILKSMSDANCLLVIPENVQALAAGQTVRIQLI